MAQTNILVFILIVTFLSWKVDAIERTEIVQLKHGKVSGVIEEAVDGKKVNFYQGIKYGQASRFEKAQPVAPWSEVYDASSFRAACHQFGLANDSIDNPLLPGTKLFSEDCLYLNVWAPVEKRENRSVMFWIHGGAFETGTIFTTIMDGKNLAQQGDVIVVSINYRLGPLGWIYADKVPSNLGMHDQILALEWVKENIHAFGGDPNQVTIFGESAGSISVGILVLSPLAKGLFKRAIMQSGAPTAEFIVQSKAKLEAKTKIFAHNSQCPTDNLAETLACLRNKTIAQLQEGAHDDFVKNHFFVPLYGDEVLPLRPVDAIKAGKVNHVDVMYGVTRDEGAGFAPIFVPDLTRDGAPDLTLATAKEKMMFIMKFYEHTDGQEIADYYAAHLKSNPTQDDLKSMVSSVWGDFHLVCPTILFGEQMAAVANENHYYAYRLVQEFNVPGLTPNSTWQGVQHGQDLLYLFMPQFAKLSGHGEQLSKDMISAWTSFAKTGKPGKMNSKVEWEEAFDHSTKSYITRYMNLDATDYKMVDKYFQQICDVFWKPKIFTAN